MNSEEKPSGSLLFPGALYCKKGFALFERELSAMEKIRSQFSDVQSSVVPS